MSVDHSLDLIQQAIKEGLDPSNLSRAQYTWLSIKIRSNKERIEDLRRATSSRVRTFFGDTVSVEKQKANEDVCRSNVCGKFRIIKPTIITSEGKKIKGSDAPACDACNCHGQNLISKWQDPREACPLRLWSNA